MKYIRSQVYTRWFLVLLATVLTNWCLQRTGYRIEDIQTATFPIILIAAWRLPRSHRYAIPFPVLLAVLLLWGGSALRVRGYIDDPLLKRGVFLSRLDGDPSGVVGQTLRWRFNEIAATYSLPRMQLMQREIESDAEGEKWLDARQQAFLLLRGDVDTYHLLLPPSSRIVPFVEDEVAARTVRPLAERFGFSSVDGLYVVQAENFPTPLVLVVSPERIDLPSEPADLSQHYLASFALGLTSPDATDLHVESEFRRNAFLSAASMGGPWKTPTPRALAYFLAGSLDLIQGIRGGSAEAATQDCGGGEVWKARDLIQEQFAGNLVAAARNNLAVFDILRVKKKKLLEDIRDKFIEAIDTEDSFRSRGARAAMLNLILLDRTGVFKH